MAATVILFTTCHFGRWSIRFEIEARGILSSLPQHIFDPHLLVRESECLNQLRGVVYRSPLGRTQLKWDSGSPSKLSAYTLSNCNVFFAYFFGVYIHVFLSLYIYIPLTQDFRCSSPCEQDTLHLISQFYALSFLETLHTGAPTFASRHAREEPGRLPGGGPSELS